MKRSVNIANTEIARDSLWGRPTAYNNALPLFVERLFALDALKPLILLRVPVRLYTPSPGGKHRQEEGLCSPVQGRRECGTLPEMQQIVLTKCIRIINI
jgi:hypothetical protein